LGVSQTALATRAGISQPYLSQVEAGTRGEVRTGIAQKLADALPRRGRTEVWLYQMRERPDWTWRDFCRDVREGRLIPAPWDESQSVIYRLGGRLPHAGDLLVLLFDSVGLCALAVVTEFGTARRLRFRALPPTETLQETPRWSPDARRVVEAIRRGAVPRATMWRMTDVTHVEALLAELFDELSGRWLSRWAARAPGRAIERTAALR
jgi:transcriptional regulator with XRE-family HTH domain